jgi:copper resistance protein B
MGDDIRTLVGFDELELFDANRGAALAWDADFWAGIDINKFWLRTDGERVDGRTKRAAAELLYSRAIAPFWDLQTGLRHEVEPRPDRDALAIVARGLAPYRFDIEAGLYIGEAGRHALRAEVGYELLLTQRLILKPELELVAHATGDAARGVASGLSEIGFGVRLRYEIRREFAPYLGFRWHRLLGGTGDLSEALGNDPDDIELVLGLRFWH